MAPRTVPEWVGKTADSAIPDKVIERVLDRYRWTCASCKRPDSLTGPLEMDHIQPLVSFPDPETHGNRETNLQPLCRQCHGLKTGKDNLAKVLASGHKKMRPGHKRAPNPHGFAAKRERLRVKFNWKTGRYEPE